MAVKFGEVQFGITVGVKKTENLKLLLRISGWTS